MNSYPKLQNLDKNLFKNITDYLTDLQTIRIVGKPAKNADGTTSVEFRHELFCSDKYTFQVSGYINQSKKSLVVKINFLIMSIKTTDHL